MTNGAITYVLATGSTAHAAMRARAAVRDTFGACELRARNEERWHYGDAFGFTYVDLAPEDPIEGAIRHTRETHERWTTELAERPGNAFVEPLTIILASVALATVSGFFEEAGADTYRAAKRGLVQRLLGRWRRRRTPVQEPSGSPLADLFDELGLISAASMVEGGLVLLRVLEPDVTFVCEHDLPRAAGRGAAALVLSDDVSHRYRTPLRWNHEASRWDALPTNWASEEQLRKVRHEPQGGDT